MPQSTTVGDLLKSLTDKSGTGTTLLYQSYLLRLWRDNASGPWRATLEQVATGKTYSFARLETLIAFLNDPTQPPSGSDQETMPEATDSAGELPPSIETDQPLH